MGRSIYYPTANMDATLGSIKLLTSHQTKDGYLGNLCPIQAPVHEEAFEPPTYAFYSLSYALLLLVAIKHYWMYSEDVGIVRSVWCRLEKLISFTERFVDERGLVVAPPPLSSKLPIFIGSNKAYSHSRLVSHGRTNFRSLWQDQSCILRFSNFYEQDVPRR